MTTAIDPRKGPLQSIGTFQKEDPVTLKLGGVTIPGCRVASVKHYSNDVKYDIVVPVEGYEFIKETIISDVESICVID